MIAEHREPKGLPANAAPLHDALKVAFDKDDAERGSMMLRDAILIAKGIAPPALKTRKIALPVRPKRAACPHCKAPMKRTARVAEVQQMVAAYYGLHPASMTSAERRMEVSHPRQIAMFLALEITRKPYTEIGRLFGGRDHTTVIHAARVVRERIAADAELFADVNALRESLVA